MADRLEPAFSIPKDFKIHEVRPRVSAVLQGVAALAAAPPPPPLGPLAAFEGTWIGIGFNTIFRPQKQTFPLPHPAPGDNLLELNLTSETLSFSSSLGSIPNRGTLQDDIFLNGVPYVQAINDVTNPGQSTGIHFEPGIWLIVPETTAPKEGVTVARMASIPHGTTIEAQGIAVTSAGPPNIRAVDITPTKISDGTKVTLPVRRRKISKPLAFRRIWRRSCCTAPSLRLCWTSQTPCFALRWPGRRFSPPRR